LKKGEDAADEGLLDGDLRDDVSNVGRVDKNSCPAILADPAGFFCKSSEHLRGHTAELGVVSDGIFLARSSERLVWSVEELSTPSLAECLCAMFADFGGALLGDGGGLRVLNFTFIWPGGALLGDGRGLRVLNFSFIWLKLEDGMSELFLLRSSSS